MSLTVDIVAPDRKLWSGEATFVSAPSVEGSIGFLPGHEPILALLSKGIVKVKKVDGAEWSVSVDSGFVSVDHDTITIVASPSADDADA